MRDGLNVRLSRRHHQNIHPNYGNDDGQRQRQRASGKLISPNLERRKSAKKELNENRKFERRIDWIGDRDIRPGDELIVYTHQAFSPPDTNVNPRLYNVIEQHSNQQQQQQQTNHIQQNEQFRQFSLHEQELQESNRFQQSNKLSLQQQQQTIQLAQKQQQGKLQQLGQQQQQQEQVQQSSAQVETGSFIQPLQDQQQVPSTENIRIPSTSRTATTTPRPQPGVSTASLDRQSNLGPLLNAPTASKLPGPLAPSSLFNPQPQQPQQQPPQQRTVPASTATTLTRPSPVFTTTSGKTVRPAQPSANNLANSPQGSQNIQPIFITNAPIGSPNRAQPTSLRPAVATNQQQQTENANPQQIAQPLASSNPNRPSPVTSTLRPVQTFSQQLPVNNLTTAASSTTAPSRNQESSTPLPARPTQSFEQPQSSNNNLVNSPQGIQNIISTSTVAPIRDQPTSPGAAFPITQQQSLTNGSANLPQGNQAFQAAGTTLPSRVFSTAAPQAQTTARLPPIMSSTPAVTTPACNYVQTCDQVITGRNLNYQRALNIIQNEEYLSAADNIIRRNEFGQYDYEDIIEQPSSYFDDFERYNQEVLSRKKRAVEATVIDFLSLATVTTNCAQYNALGSVVFFATLTNKINNICNPICCGADYPSLPEVACCYYDTTCIYSASTIYYGSSTECKTYLNSFVATTYPAYCNNIYSICPTTTASTTSTTTTSCWNCIQQAIQVGSAVVGVGAVVAGGAIIAMPPIQPLVTAQGVPQGVPQPGTPFGGGPPVPTSAASVAALALVPFGLIPVAVFPPFARYA